MSTRRAFMMGAVGAAWAVPTIITMQPASAASVHSPPPRPPGEPVEPETVPVTIDLGSQERGSLAFTGANIKRDAEVGLGAVCAGAGLLVWKAVRGAAH